MLRDILGIYQYIINIDHNTGIQKFKKYVIHNTLESRRSIAKSKRHYSPLILAVSSAKCSFKPIFWRHDNLVVTVTQVKFGKYTGTL